MTNLITANSKVRIVFPDALDKRIIQAASVLALEHNVLPILIANPFELRDFCLANALKMQGIVVVDPKRDSRRAEYLDFLQKRMPKASLEECQARMEEPLWYAASMLAAGAANFCIAGNISSTANVLRAAIRVVGLEKGNKTVSSIMFMYPPKIACGMDSRVLGFADCGVIPEPTTEQLVDIAIAAAKNFENTTGETARVAMLSFSSLGSAKYPSTEKIAQAVALIKERQPNLCVDGELQFDAAIVPEVAQQKTANSPLKGRANVFVFPSLEAGNIGYKIAQRLGGYDAVGPMIQGLRLPMHDLSRGCSFDEIIQVSLLAMKMAQS